MKSQDKSSFEKGWEDAFDGAEMEPNDALWSKLDSHLANKEALKYKTRYRYASIAAALILLLLSIGVTGWIYTNKSVGENAIAVTQDQSISANEVATYNSKNTDDSDALALEESPSVENNAEINSASKNQVTKDKTETEQNLAGNSPLESNDAHEESSALALSKAENKRSESFNSNQQLDEATVAESHITQNAVISTETNTEEALALDNSIQYIGKAKVRKSEENSTSESHKESVKQQDTSLPESTIALQNPVNNNSITPNNQNSVGDNKTSSSNTTGHNGAVKEAYNPSQNPGITEGKAGKNILQLNTENLALSAKKTSKETNIAKSVANQKAPNKLKVLVATDTEESNNDLTAKGFNNFAVALPILVIPAVNYSVIPAELLAESKQKDKIEKERKWWASVSGGTLYFDPQFKANYQAAGPSATRANFNLSMTESFEDVSEPDYSYVASIELGRKISKKWSVKSGLQYLYYHSNLSTRVYTESTVSDEKTALVTRMLSQEATTQFDFASPQTSLNTRMNTSDETVSLENIYKYVSIPFQAVYTLNPGSKITIAVNAGLATDFFIHNKLKGTEENISSASVKAGDNSVYRSFVLSGISGVDIQYNLSKKYAITFQPQFRAALHSSTKKEASINSRPITAGVALGMRYKF